MKKLFLIFIGLSVVIINNYVYAAEGVKEISQDKRFIAYDNGTVLDTKTNLIWASIDNGKDISWEEAKEYCNKYKRAGYSNWRMPTKDELYELFGGNKGVKSECDTSNLIYKITELINLSCIWVWASDIKFPNVGMIGFHCGCSTFGPPYYIMNHRALPVRFNIP